MEPALTDLKSWARQAGELVRAGYGTKHTIRYKSAVDLVTDTDHRSEDFLIESIRRKFPDHSIITEESGDLAGLSSRRWFIDPLDGTINFSHGLPLFAISLGYAVDGEVRLGVIYDPLRDECYSAERGKGAFLNDEPIHVSDTPDLIHSLLVTGFPYDMWETPANNLNHFVNFARRCQVCAGWARRHWTWPMWLPVGWMGTGKSGSNPGISPPGRCWWKRQAGQ